MLETELPITQVHPNAWNPNTLPVHLMDSLKRSIQVRGFTQRIVVRKIGQNNYEIIDGEQRWKAARELGMETIPVVVLEQDDKDAKLSTLGHNKIRGVMTPLGVAEIFDDLVGKYSMDDLTGLSGYDELEIKDSLSLLDLPQDLDETIARTTAEELVTNQQIISFICTPFQARRINEIVDRLSEEQKCGRGAALYKICNTHSKKNSGGKIGHG